MSFFFITFPPLCINEQLPQNSTQLFRLCGPVFTAFESLVRLTKDLIELDKSGSGTSFPKQQRLSVKKPLNETLYGCYTEGQ